MPEAPHLELAQVSPKYCDDQGRQLGLSGNCQWQDDWLNEEKSMPQNSRNHLNTAECRLDEIIRLMTPARRLEFAREFYEAAWNIRLARVKRQPLNGPTTRSTRRGIAFI
jgi:hypothetical protein